MRFSGAYIFKTIKSFSSTFQGKFPIFKADWKIKHFSRQHSNSSTFQGLWEPWSIIGVCFKITNSRLQPHLTGAYELSHWGRVTHICVSKLTTIGSDIGLSPGRRQAVIWNNAGISLIWTWGTNFSEILIEIHISSFNKMHLKMSSVKCRPFCLGRNVSRWVSEGYTIYIKADRGLRPANERRRYIVTPSLIGWAQT